MQVQEIMTRRVLGIPAGETVQSAAFSMAHHGISSLLVWEEGRVTGIVTERDLVVKVLAEGHSPTALKVEDVMTRGVITIPMSASVDEACELMMENRIKKLAVVDPSSPGRMVGIVSITDVAGVRPHFLGEFKSVLDEEQLVSQLVREPEGQHLEFKASLRFNSRSMCLDPDLEFNCLKTICAFLNSEGGDLFIGVNDRNRVVGLRHDYLVVPKGNRDGFENYLLNQVANKVGSWALQYIRVTFPRVHGREICRVHVSPAPEPAFLNHHGRQYFYVRAGNGSRPFNIRDSARYIAERWPRLLVGPPNLEQQATAQTP